MMSRHLIFELFKITSLRKTLLRQCKMMFHAAWMSRYWIIEDKQRQIFWNNELESSLLKIWSTAILKVSLRRLVQEVITINFLLILYCIILIQYAADSSSKIVNKSRNTLLSSLAFLFFVDDQSILQINFFIFFRAAAESLITNRLRACLTQRHDCTRTHDVLINKCTIISLCSFKSIYLVYVHAMLDLLSQTSSTISVRFSIYCWAIMYLFSVLYISFLTQSLSSQESS